MGIGKIIIWVINVEKTLELGIRKRIVEESIKSLTKFGTIH